MAELGAGAVVDYTSQDFAHVLRDIDLVYDTVGGEEERALRVLCAQGGANYVTIVHP